MAKPERTFVLWPSPSGSPEVPRRVWRQSHDKAPESGLSGLIIRPSPASLRSAPPATLALCTAVVALIHIFSPRRPGNPPPCVA